MLNFDATSKDYRELVRWHAQEMIEALTLDHIMKGGSFNPQKITKMFNDALQSAQLVTDLFIGVGLSPLSEENKYGNTNSIAASTGQSEGGLPDNAFVKDEVGNLGKGNTEGPTGSGRDEVGMAHPTGKRDTNNYHGTAGSGEVNTTEQQPVPAVTGPGERGGHVSGPSSLEVHTTPDDGPKRAGQSVPDVR